MKSKKRLLPMLLSGLILFSTTSCGGGNTSSSTTGESAIIWSALSTDRYMQDQVLQDYPQAELDFVGMKGETTALQVMITANEYIKSFDLELSDLTGENGATFSKDNFAVYAEKYIELALPYTNSNNKGETTYADMGFYPDALVPIDRYIANREARVRKGENQGIWVDCIIPADAVPGSYSGTFTLSYGTKTKEIPVSLYVYNLTMPEEVHSRTLFGLWYEQLSFGEREFYSTETDKIYYDFLASKRVSTDDPLPSAQKSTATMIEFMESVAENPKITTYLFPRKLLNINENILSPSPENADKYTENQQTAEAEKLEKSITNVLKAVLERNLALRAEGNEDIDLLKKLVFAIEDEPGGEYRTKKVKIMGERLTAAKRNVAEAYATQLEAHPDLLDSLLNKVEQFCAANGVGSSALSVSSKNPDAPTPGSAGYEPDYEKGDGLTLWCPEGYKFKDKSFRDKVKERQAYGEKFLWYNCCSTSPTLSFYLDAQTVSLRAFSWRQYEYGIVGQLYWDTVHWTTTMTGDPYKDISHSNGWGAGEGILLYPGVKYGLKQPISSIRLEQIFHGQQDYEYFYMLDGYLKANEIQTTAEEIINPLLVNLLNNALAIETATGSDLEEGRIKVLDLLQDFANGNVESAKAKINAIIS